MFKPRFYCLVLVAWVNLWLPKVTSRCDASEAFGIRIVDESNRRGVPLASLRTTNGMEYWSDNNGWIAFHEPGMMNQEVFFSFESPGYTVNADGFGFRGIKLRTVPGKTVDIPVRRTNLAERMYRITGQGLFRDSELLQQPYPLEIPQLNAGVVGSDSVQMVPYGDKLFWLWGDTNLVNYPLGNFHVTAAQSDPLPRLQIQNGIALQYFIDSQTQRVKKMMPASAPGAIWLWGLMHLEDDSRAGRLVAHYSRHIKPGEMVEHGIAAWNEENEIFEKQVAFSQSNTWQHPRGNAVRHKGSDGDFIYFVEPFATTRVPARWEDILKPDSYQSFAWDDTAQRYVWQSKLPPATQSEETTLIAKGRIAIRDAHFQILERESNQPVQMHRGSIEWNAFRKRWIMIACETNPKDSPSFLGEIWYAEAEKITGPWKSAIKIASHPKYSFYNPRHHVPFDQENGRIIYFEGTYTQMFSSNRSPTPRYEYNQILYRLDLSTLDQRATRP